MRKTLFLLAFLLGCLWLNAQDYRINLHGSGSVIYDNSVGNIGQIYFEEGKMLINAGCGYSVFPLMQFDSITFVKPEDPPAGDPVYINYNEYAGSVEITNPFSNSGVSISTNGYDVTVNSTQSDVLYIVNGQSDNGSLTIYSTSSFELTLSYLSLTSTTTAAINIPSPVDVTLTVESVSILADGASSDINGALYAAGSLNINCNGFLQVTGNAKHGILVDGNMTMNNGEIYILDSDSDGIHCGGNLTWNDGRLTLESAGSDGLDVSGNVTIQNGELNINTTAEGQRGIKVSGIFTMNHGSLEITCSGIDSKCIKCDRPTHRATFLVCFYNKELAQENVAQTIRLATIEQVESMAFREDRIPYN